MVNVLPLLWTGHASNVEEDILPIILDFVSGGPSGGLLGLHALVRFGRTCTRVRDLVRQMEFGQTSIGVDLEDPEGGWPPAYSVCMLPYPRIGLAAIEPFEFSVDDAHAYIQLYRVPGQLAPTIKLHVFIASDIQAGRHVLAHEIDIDPGWLVRRVLAPAGWENSESLRQYRKIAAEEKGDTDSDALPPWSLRMSNKQMNAAVADRRDRHTGIAEHNISSRFLPIADPDHTRTPKTSYFSEAMLGMRLATECPSGQTNAISGRRNYFESDGSIGLFLQGAFPCGHREMGAWMKRAELLHPGDEDDGVPKVSKEVIGFRFWVDELRRLAGGEAEDAEARLTAFRRATGDLAAPPPPRAPRPRTAEAEASANGVLTEADVQARKRQKAEACRRILDLQQDAAGAEPAEDEDDDWLPAKSIDRARQSPSPSPPPSPTAGPSRRGAAMPLLPLPPPPPPAPFPPFPPLPPSNAAAASSSYTHTPASSHVRVARLIDSMTAAELMEEMMSPVRLVPPPPPDHGLDWSG